ncbi:hypothetical protein [Rhodoferax aquaticus]|uniref:Uncharacterized protein n=1 Tax=Rhodoferax aquaticus TaxID=2527691 RepID=A0A515EQ01_9BURK|nr:hypothetical protein [Rhodoferax aquaticus]QDL54705.1 hypothetical protein EXZ61_11290 [Rhodoferax aquaticus]
MTKLHWQALSTAQLSALLNQNALVSSSEVDGATIYHLQGERAQGDEQIAVALPNGRVIVVGPAPNDAPRRRRIEVSN